MKKVNQLFANLMGNRSKKRVEVEETTLTEKQACSSLGRDESENVRERLVVVESGSAVVNESHTEADYERMGNEYSVEESNAMRDYQSTTAAEQMKNLCEVITSLGKQDIDESSQFAALMDLCEQLSYADGNSISTVMLETLSPILVSLAKHETNPNIMLLAIRAVAYTCDVNPVAAGFFVKHGAIAALCQRLIAIEYLDVAEQSLQALDKISRYQPKACLQSGVAMSALTYIDFFSTSIQRVVLSIIGNVCYKLPAELPSSLMEAIPILCNLLHYEDQQVVERVATCLIKMTSQVSHSSKSLHEICNYGVVSQIVHIIDVNNRPTIAVPSQTVYTGLIGLLTKLACGSVMAYKTLFELNITTILRDILLSYHPSSGLPFLNSGGGHYNQMQEVLKLLNELLPCVDEVRNAGAIVSEKQLYLLGHPEILQTMGINVLPHLIQVVNMDADMVICYGCVYFIHKLVYYAEPEVVLELLPNLNISSFLAGVFTRNDPHIVILALRICETILQKQYDSFMNSFVKDGVFFAIEALLKSDLSSQFVYPMIEGTHVSNEPGQQAAQQDGSRCLCYALSNGRPSTSSTCNLKQSSVNDLAKQIKLNLFPKESGDCSTGLTEVHRELKALSIKLIELLTACESRDDGYSELDVDMQHCLLLIMNKLNCSEPVSTFEFIESGVITALLTFLSHGIHMSQDLNAEVIISHHRKVDARFQIFARLFMLILEDQSWNSLALMLVQKLQSVLSTVENFPVILCQPFKLCRTIAFIPDNQPTLYPTFKVQFLRGEGENNLIDYSSKYVTVNPFTSLKDIAEQLWHVVSTTKNNELSTQADTKMECAKANEAVVEGNTIDRNETDCMDAHLGDQAINEPEGSSNLSLYIGEQKLDLHLTLYQAILQQQLNANYDSVSSSKFWSHVYTVTFRSASTCEENVMNQLYAQSFEPSWLCAFTIFQMFDHMITSNFDQMSAARDVLYLIKSLEWMNRNLPSLPFQEKATFADHNIEKMNIGALCGVSVPQIEFVNSRLTEKLEQQLKDHAAITVGGLPSWWNQLMESCPFLFAFDTRCKYFRLSVIGPPLYMRYENSHISANSYNERRGASSGLPREKFLAIRDNVLESASKMMEQHADQRAILEVEFGDEVGTGLGPTLEFYTLVSHEFQRTGLGLWREDSLMQHTSEISGFVVSRYGLFPRPWYCPEDGSDDTMFLEVIKKFALLGQLVAKALHDGRVLDLHLSKAFYKIILGQNLDLHDIQLFDPELGRAIQKFKSVSQKNLFHTKMSSESLTSKISACYTEIEDLALDFTLPGYPDYFLHAEKHNDMVTLDNLEEYVSLVVDATVNSGIYRQLEAFEAGFNQVFPIEDTYIFTEDELERLLCGEDNLFVNPDELLNHVKFDHGYSASSPPILNLLEVLLEFDYDQQRAFVQFVTGTPRLPTGRLASLNPQLTVVRKHSDNFVDDELPSAMTCVNYLKLPPYSSKAIMKEKLLYAILEGQGSFHLS